MSLRRFALAATLATALVAPAAAAQDGGTRGLRYTFTMSGSGDDDVTRGTVRAIGDRSRIDLDGKDGNGTQWLLVTNGGRTVAFVNPKERSYSEVDADQFAGLVGTVIRGLDKLITIELDEATVSTQRIGAGGVIAGHATERWAITQEFVVNVGAFGKTSPEMHRVVTDYWIARDVRLPRNPIVELVTQTETALAQANADFVKVSAAKRRELPAGAPLRIVVTSISSDAEKMTAKAPKTRRMEVTGLGEATIDPAALQVPAGYERKKGIEGLKLDL